MQLAAESTLTLDEAIRRFLDQSPEIGAARERVEAARGDLRQAAAFPNPVVHFSQEGFPFGREDARFLEDQEFLFWGSQEFELGGKRGHRTREARFRLQQVESEFEDFVLQATTELKELFAEVFYRQRQTALSSELISVFDNLRETHRRRLQEGDVSGLDQLKIEAEEIAYQARHAGVQTSLTEAWLRLASRVGWSEAQAPQLQVRELPEAVRFEEAELKRKALESRSDLQALRRGLQQSEARFSLERAQAVPDLTVGAGYKRDFGQNSYYLAFQLPLPLFNRNQGAVERAAAELRRHQNLILWKQIDVSRQVGAALADFRLQRAVAARLHGVYEKVGRVAEITRQSYLEGEATLLEYLDALRVRRDASMAYYDLLLQLRRSWIRLEAGVGGPLP